MRQITDEADGIGQNHARLVRQEQPSRCGIQSGEQLVFRQYVRFGQAVEQAGFSSIGIADNGKGFQTAAHARFTACGTLFADIGKLFFNAVIFFVRLNGGRFPTGFRPALSSRYRPSGFANVHNRVPAVRSNGSTGPTPPATYLPAIGRVWRKSPKSNPLCRVRGIEALFPDYALVSA